jgi:ADP-L-glycero-D-manno-heptose 6-epimerase
MILVTGGAGFIGSNIVAALNAAGRDDVAVCDFLGGGVKWRNLAKASVSDIVAPEDLPDFLAANAKAIDAIVHMGAISSTTETNVELIVETNYRLSRRLWRFCAERGIRRSIPTAGRSISSTASSPARRARARPRLGNGPGSNSSTSMGRTNITKAL